MTGAQRLIEAQTQGVQPGNEVPGLRSHASQAVIGTTLCSLKPRPSEQLIVTLSGFHDNCHAYRQYGFKKKKKKDICNTLAGSGLQVATTKL